MYTDQQILKLREKLMLLIICLIKIDLIISQEYVSERSLLLEDEVKESGFTELEEQNIITTLNNNRKFVSPTAADMIEVVWNEELSKLAKKWSDKCKLHNLELTRCGKLISQENSALNDEGFNYHKIFYEWSLEKIYFNYTENICDDICDHYQMMVNAKIHSVGCSRSHCKSEEGVLTIIICNFYPFVGDFNELPYEAGPSCSRCPNNTTCLSNQKLCEYSDRHIPREELTACNIELPVKPTSVAQRRKCSNMAKLMIIFSCITGIISLP